MIRAELLKKIRKCLALGRSANEHEAAAAMAKARELMDAHGVGEDDLLEIEQATARRPRSARPARWELILAQSVAHATGCETILVDDDRAFIGPGPASEIAAYAWQVLLRQIRRARTDYIRLRLRRCRPGRKRLRADLYCEGWALAVQRKVKAIAPSIQSGAISKWIVRQYPDAIMINGRSAQPRRMSDHADRMRGAVAGDDVFLNRPMQGPGATSHLSYTA